MIHEIGDAQVPESLPVCPSRTSNPRWWSDIAIVLNMPGLKSHKQS